MSAWTEPLPRRQLVLGAIVALAPSVLASLDSDAPVSETAFSLVVLFVALALAALAARGMTRAWGWLRKPRRTVG